MQFLNKTAASDGFRAGGVSNYFNNNYLSPETIKKAILKYG